MHPTIAVTPHDPPAFFLSCLKTPRGRSLTGLKARVDPNEF